MRPGLFGLCSMNGTIRSGPAPLFIDHDHACCRRIDAGARQRLTARFGHDVQAWFDKLPGALNALAQRWQFELGSAIPRGSVSIVFRCRMADGRRAVIKASPDRARLAVAATALNAWHTVHTLAVIALDEQLGALLIEEIQPGTPLVVSSIYRQVEQIAELLSSLHASGVPDPCYPTLGQRVGHLFDSSAQLYQRHPQLIALIGPDIYERGRRLATRLAQHDGPIVLLHGDLTPSNILDGAAARGLVAIDPAPCLGDPAFDAVDLILWQAGDLQTIEARIGVVSGDLQILHARLSSRQILLRDRGRGDRIVIGLIVVHAAAAVAAWAPSRQQGALLALWHVLRLDQFGELGHLGAQGPGERVRRGERVFRKQQLLRRVEADDVLDLAHDPVAGGGDVDLGHCAAVLVTSTVCRAAGRVALATSQVRSAAVTAISESPPIVLRCVVLAAEHAAWRGYGKGEFAAARARKTCECTGILLGDQAGVSVRDSGPAGAGAGLVGRRLPRKNAIVTGTM
jgi:streptomycin 6-kinase